MTDVIALAKERRARLAAEMAKLDEFIHMGDMLVKYSPAKDGDDELRRDKSGADVVRPYPAAGRDAKG